MDINQIRFSNYQALFRQFVEDEQAQGIDDRGTLARFGAKCGIGHKYMSHINSRRKNIGDKSARAMEKAFRKPHGWLDVDHAAGTKHASEETQAFVDLCTAFYLRLPDRARLDLMKYMADRFMAEQDAPTTPAKKRTNVKA